MSTTSVAAIPAIRARIGDWWYYTTTMTFAEVAAWVKKVDDIHEPKELKTWIQRELRDERTQQIATYLTSQEQRFFNAIVVGIYGGEPEWLPVEVGDSVTVKGFELDDRHRNSFGFVHLSGAEQIFAIDGQHRVEGIKEALKSKAELGKDEQTVIFVAHKTTEAGRQRTRRLFSTLNKYAKPVSQSEIVALSEDDAFAIVTRRLIDEYPGLGPEFVPLLPAANIPANERSALTTVVGLWELTKIISPAAIRRQRKKLENGPPVAQVVEQIHAASVGFWDALKANVPEVRTICSSDPAQQLAGKQRTPEGGHLLFRPVGLKAFARATRVLADRGVSMDTAVKKLAKVPLQLDSPIWRDVLWQPETKTMVNKFSRLAFNLLLHKAGEKADSNKYDVPAQYFKITGRAIPGR